jgi:hypothetical protein
MRATLMLITIAVLSAAPSVQAEPATKFPKGVRAYHRMRPAMGGRLAAARQGCESVPTPGWLQLGQQEQSCPRRSVALGPDIAPQIEAAMQMRRTTCGAMEAVHGPDAAPSSTPS